MRKNIIAMSIVGMFLLSSFITISVADDTIVITITLSDVKPIDKSLELPVDQENVSVTAKVEKHVGTSFGEYLNFSWEIGGKNITKSKGTSPYPDAHKIFANISGPLYTNTNITWYVNVSAVDNNTLYYKNETFWFITYNQPPVANFTNTTHGLKVDFNGTLSHDPDGTIENYTWYFGDGSKGYGNTIQHIYGGSSSSLADDNMTYYVTLNVTDDAGKYDNETIPVSVKNAAPVADFTYKADLKNVGFDASSSYDVDGSIVKYAWDFGDGNVSSEMKPVHAFADEYTKYNVTLTVTDNNGKSASIYKFVTTNDTTLPVVKIEKPERAFYIGNKKIRRLFLRMALIIGSITVDVNASDSGCGIERVEFYVNNVLKANDTTAPYTFNWTKDRLFRLVHTQVLKVVAYDKYGNSASDKMLVKKFL